MANSASRSSLLASTAVLGLLISGASALAADVTYQFNIDAEPLSQALQQYGLQTSQQIIFSQDIVRGQQAPALRGRYTASQALSILLADTDLTTRLGESGVVMVQKKNNFASPAAGPLILAQAGPSQNPSVSMQAANDIERVVVSASRVTIAGYSQPTPVTMIGAAELKDNAFANIQDSVRNLPQINSPPSSFGITQSGASGGTVGTNLVNLRNLGVTRTLVLFDSQRVVSSGLGNGSNSGVDITTLPSAMVSRVDIVTGGASAAWGSDAVAGVVNFVINKNFTGLKATIQGGANYKGTARDFFVESAWGEDILGGRGHFQIAANAHLRPDVVVTTDANWFKAAYWVSNPAYAPGNGQPQLIVASNVGLASATMGGIINSSPAGPIAPVNALRGIQFVGNGIPQIVNYGNVTLGTLSNGGSLTARDTQNSWSTIANPSNTYTFFGYGRYRLTDAVRASIQLNYGYFTGKGNAPGVTQTSLVIKSDNAFIPASVRATMQAGGIASFTMGTLNGNNYNAYTATGANFYAQAEGSLAPGITFNRRNLARGVFMLEGAIGDGGTWNAYILHGDVRYNSHILAQPIVANITAAQDAITVTVANRGTSGLPLGSVVCRTALTGTPVIVGNVTAQPGCIPLNVFGEGVASPAAIAYIVGETNTVVNSDGSVTSAQDFQHQSLKQDVAEASMQGTLPWQLPAGKIAVAFGAGYRKEAARAITTPIAIAAGYTSGNFTSFPPASYNVVEGFAELNAPILKNNFVNSFDISMAGRMTSYSTSGLVETWKLGATSQINDDIKLRTTWSVDIRAPQLIDLYSQGVPGVGNNRDPKTQLTVPTISITAGNPDLVPEVARTISGGVVLTPTFIQGVSMSVDWYSINLTGAIASVPQTTILAACNPTQPSPVHPGQNGNPNDPLCSHLVFAGPNGALSQINVSQINFASQSTSGLDVQANYIVDFWQGLLAWSATASLTDHNTTSQPGLGVNDIAGSNNANGTVAAGPKWRGVLAVTYTTGPVSATAQARWFGTGVVAQNGNTGNQAIAATANLYDPAHFHVPFMAYLNLRGNYKWNGNVSLYGAVDNTLNTPPPLVPTFSSITSFGNAQYYGTNPITYDLLGRTFRFGVRFEY